MDARRVWIRGQVDDPRWRRGLVGPSAGGLRDHTDAWRQRHWSSRLLQRIGELTAHAAAGLVAAAAVLAWVVVGFLAGFPGWWETALYSVSSSITLVMVFAIQHTQTRQQSAIQRKLDELLRSQASADDGLVAVEEAPDEELEARADLNLADRERAGGTPR